MKKEIKKREFTPRQEIETNRYDILGRVRKVYTESSESSKQEADRYDILGRVRKVYNR